MDFFATGVPILNEHFNQETTSKRIYYLYVYFRHLLHITVHKSAIKISQLKQLLHTHSTASESILNGTINAN